MDVVTLGAALSIMKKMPDTAASSAAAAEDAADRAEEAADDAIDAKTAAEAAQAAAEAAARDSGVRVGDPASKILFEVGGFNFSNGTLTASANGNRIRTKRDSPLYLREGDSVYLSDYADAQLHIYRKLSESAWADLGWKTAAFAIPETGFYHIMIANKTEVQQTGTDALGALFNGYNPPLFDYISANTYGINNANTIYLTWNDGYINNKGGIAQYPTQGSIYSDIIPCEYGDVFDLKVEYSEPQSPEFAYALYDENGIFITRDKPAVTSSSLVTNAKYTVSRPDAKYIAFTFHSYSNIYAFNIKVSTASNTEHIQKDISALKKIINRVESDDTYVKSVNHRGWHKAPENTLPAFIESKQNGFNYVECDVSFTSDGVPVLLHDVSINRTARNADGSEIEDTININSITYDELLDYDFGIYKGDKYAGTKIPTFTEFLSLCKKIGIKPYVEIKANESHSQERIDGLVDIVKDCAMEEQVTWISGAVSNLTKVQNTTTKGRYGYVVAHVAAEMVAQDSDFLALKKDCNEIFLDSSTYTNAELSLCKNARVPLEVYTINSNATIAALPVYISGVTSDSNIASNALYKSALSQ